MTPLEAILIDRIKAAGPITVADYMDTCLLHPEHGYYVTQNPFGAAGDFTTAPEISQMFGELLGLCLAQSWLDQGSPGRFVLAELGPGRGTLMADILRATRAVPGFHTAAEVVLVEASPRLRALQRKTLGVQVVDWQNTIDGLPQAPLYIVANEFFDALPIRQFIRAAKGWSETVVTVRDGVLSVDRTDAPAMAALAARLADTGTGDIVELRPAASPIMVAIGERIARHGGLALISDYGDWQSRGDTLQAVRAHGFVPVLEKPGLSDVTAHVDFGDLARWALPCETRFAMQGEVLLRLGLTERTARLAEKAGAMALEQHLAATQRLTAPDKMGTLFKVLAVHARNAPTPPGFV